MYGRRFFVLSFFFFFLLEQKGNNGNKQRGGEWSGEFFNAIRSEIFAYRYFTTYTVIGFHLSTSDTTGSAIESSKPNPILIDVRERRGVTIARIIFGATNTTYSGRPPDLGELLSYYILTRDGGPKNFLGHHHRPSIG